MSERDRAYRAVQALREDAERLAHEIGETELTVPVLIGALKGISAGCPEWVEHLERVFGLQRATTHRAVSPAPRAPMPERGSIESNGTG